MGLLDAFGGWFKKEEVKPVAAAWKPEFLKPVGYGPNGYVNPFVNPAFFAAQATAEEVMKRVGAQEMFQRVAPGNEGPLYTCSELQWWLRWPDGLEMNAGQIADFWLRNPEDQFPGVAQQFANNWVALGRQEARVMAQQFGYPGIREYFRGQFSAPVVPKPTT